MENLPKKGKKLYSGQALLLVLLSMAVILTSVLSVASRSISDIKVTSYEEDSYRAFSAAEAGVEESLFTGAGASGGGGDVSYISDISHESAGSSFDYPINLRSGEVATFWFVSHDPDNLNKFRCDSHPHGEYICTKAAQLEVCWGDGSASPAPTPEPAMILSIFYDPPMSVVGSNDYSSVEVLTQSYEPNATRQHDNNFDFPLAGNSLPSCSFGGTSYKYSTGQIKVASASLLPGGCATSGSGGCLLMAIVKMVYNTAPQPVGIKISGVGSSSLPSQGLLVESTGKTEEVVRKVNVFQGYPLPPSFFDAALFSLDDITK